MLRKRMNYLIHIKKSKGEFWNRFSKIFENLTVNFAFPIEYCNITQNQLSANLSTGIGFSSSEILDAISITNFLFIFNLFSFIVKKSEKNAMPQSSFLKTFFFFHLIEQTCWTTYDTFLNSKISLCKRRTSQKIVKKKQQKQQTQK